MSAKSVVSVVIGSLRKESFSRKVAHALMAQAPASLECRIVEIADLPMYNEDLDERPPEQWTRFRDAIRSSRAVLFVTPEYNRSIPGCLKNAVDVASRPSEQECARWAACGCRERDALQARRVWRESCDSADVCISEHAGDAAARGLRVECG